MKLIDKHIVYFFELDGIFYKREETQFEIHWLKKISSFWKEVDKDEELSKEYLERQFSRTFFGKSKASLC